MRWEHLRNLELDRYVAQNGKIPISIDQGQDNSGAKSFLQGKHELAEQRGHPINRVELFMETYARSGQFVLPAVADAHNQMLKHQSQPTPKGSQPLSKDEICETILDRRPSYSNGLG
ncbi:CACTA en-spm transposon protein [Cucumis melo var. makuwa]|uniref:CACTA en-spm transposon protein n=1 Tax=Cucumis melo var. makuwa TaxID=1194695 RepID=A0A5D3DYI9_CUCMM|nr:CACTA en-spm transposon protein [Cucumis melo var. makuwa]TYK28957.1 CACTA en-spm transposon protein [Cucumis melo var. makuwa]